MADATWTLPHLGNEDMMTCSFRISDIEFVESYKQHWLSHSRQAQSALDPPNTPERSIGL
jgi:hypothetical protein